MGIALTTGSSTGIGMATAVTLARAGHTVIATMRNLRGGDALRTMIAAEKLPVKIIEMNVDDDASVERAMAHILAENGQIDILINNAGVGGAGAVEEMPLAEFRQVMETNYFGALRCIKAVLPAMRNRRSGRIINVSSIAGRFAAAPQASYAASKWALEALSECLAQEVKAFNIRVAIVEPGVVATAIFGKGKPLVANSPYPHTRRLGALFAASLRKPVSPYVVGDVIRQIAETESWQLRYPVGPDAGPMLAMRAAISDEDWVSRGAQSDDEWAAGVKRERGLDVKTG